MEQSKSLHHPRDDVARSRWQHACIYIWTNKIAGSTSRVEESSVLGNATGVGGGSLQDPECGRSMRSHYGRSPWNFHFNPTIWLTSAWRSYIISQLLTSLWSGGDNSMPGKQLNPQHPLPHQQHKPHPGWRRMWNSSDWIGWRWKGQYRIGELIHRRAQFSNTLQELKQLQFCNRTIQLQE